MARDVTDARARLARLLETTTAFTLSVTRGDPSTQLIGAGQVTVTASEHADGRCIMWQEWGRWGDGPLEGMTFRNRVRWEMPACDDAILLSHLRRGVGSPTPLVRLYAVADDCWRSEQPHLCGADTYAATVTTQAGVLVIHWDVTSPTDPYRMEWRASMRGP